MRSTREMMCVVYQVVLSLHVLFAIFWFGSVLLTNFVVIPSLLTISFSSQSEFTASFSPKLDAALIPAAVLTILSGVAVGLLGGVGGQLGSAYGRTWIAAFVVATLTLIWALAVIAPNVKKLQKLPPGSPNYAAQTNRVKAVAPFELLGFLVVFVLMMMMRFGY